MTQKTRLYNWGSLETGHLRDGVKRAGFSGLIRIPPGVEHYGEPVGDETAMSLDIFSPIRSDYRHLVEYRQADFGRE